MHYLKLFLGLSVILLVTALSPLRADESKELIAQIQQLADQGDAESQFNLGLMYAEGMGVPKNNVTAYIWFNLAASNASGNVANVAREARNLVANNMTDSEKLTAQKQMQCITQHSNGNYIYNQRCNQF